MNKTLIGYNNLDTKATLSFQIPNNIFPVTAKEILLHATVQCGHSTAAGYPFVDVSFYVEENGIQFKKLLLMRGYPQHAFKTNSDNMWFPMPSNRMVYIEVPVALSRHCDTSISATGYC